MPAAGSQDLLHGGLCAEDDAVFHLHEPPPSHRFHHVRIEQLSQRHPARFGHWASRLASRWLHPVPAMRHDGSEVMRVPITQKERHTPRRYQLSDVMEHGLRHRQRAVTDLDAQQHFGLRIDRGPDLVGGPREPLDRLGCTSITVSDRTEHGVQFVELDLLEV